MIKIKKNKATVSFAKSEKQARIIIEYKNNELNLYNLKNKNKKIGAEKKLQKKGNKKISMKFYSPDSINVVILALLEIKEKLIRDNEK